MVPAAAGLAAFVSVPVAALAFVLLYAVGGRPTSRIDSLATAMVGVHLLIGVGEGVITFLAVGGRSSPSGPTWCTAPAACSPAGAGDQPRVVA